MCEINSNKGYCVICESETVFSEYGKWLRDYYVCGKCMSIPRQRAIISAIKLFVPCWKELQIHESSPDGCSSDFLSRYCKNYSFSQFFEGKCCGSLINGIRCEDLEKLTFDDSSFDLIVTQDVFEHIMRPDLAFKEIARVLKPQGTHIFTVPWNPLIKTEKRVEIVNGKEVLIKEAIYHKNPVDVKGSIVTYDWGIDMAEYIFEKSGMYTIIYLNKDRTLGLDGEYLHVFVSRKS